VSQTIRLLDHDPDLARTLRPDRVEEARRSALVDVVRLPRGRWPGPARAAASPYGLLLLDGLVSRTVVLEGIAASQLLGRGDLLARDAAGDEALVATDLRWTVLEPALVALLDERFLFVVRRWPELGAALFERVAAQSARLGTQRALCHLPRVEDRVHTLLWFLAERWGRVSPHGVVVPVKLTHDMLGQLVGAKRPTVSLAIKLLEERGSLRRRADGGWLLTQAWTAPVARETGDASSSVAFVPGGEWVAVG
jgi:CRP/FNR family cyclic AMP-dependent transcriptional regulator